MSVSNIKPACYIFYPLLSNDGLGYSFKQGIKHFTCMYVCMYVCRILKKPLYNRYARSYFMSIWKIKIQKMLIIYEGSSISLLNSGFNSQIGRWFQHYFSI